MAITIQRFEGPCVFIASRVCLSLPEAQACESALQAVPSPDAFLPTPAPEPSPAAKVLIERAGGWVRGLPNHAIDGGHVCPSCGSGRLQSRGVAHSKTRRYRRFQCRDCGGWSQATKCEPGGAKVKGVA